MEKKTRSIESLETELLEIKLRMKNLMSRAVLDSEMRSLNPQTESVKAEIKSLKMLSTRIELALLLLDQYDNYRNFCKDQAQSWDKIAQVSRSLQKF